MKQLSIFIFTAFAALVSCSPKPAQEQAIVKPSDYAVYLDRKDDQAMTRVEAGMAFCREKLRKTPDSETYRSQLAGLFSARFALNGKIEDIFASDSLYHVVQRSTPIDYSYIHRALAANCITQHQFREASRHIDTALQIGDGKAASVFMKVDADVELGNLSGARAAMKTITNRNFFPWIIREAKIKDHEGKLDTAIILMEKALTKVSDNPINSLWTLSNLADMYGHAGRVKEAYAMYLKVLKIEPDYDYALKGIAWIAFSHDHNFAEAKRIATYIAVKRATPDMHLFLAQIATQENNIPEKKRELDLFTGSARNPKYGDMYNKYLALLEAEEFSNPAKTVSIGEREVHNRPTPQSYDLLAWGYLNAGEVKQALMIAREHIENKTWEPDALYHLGMIYQANGLKEEAQRYFEKASESYFELGPAKAQKIREKLSS